MLLNSDCFDVAHRRRKGVVEHLFGVVILRYSATMEECINFLFCFMKCSIMLIASVIVSVIVIIDSVDDLLFCFCDWLFGVVWMLRWLLSAEAVMLGI